MSEFKSFFTKGDRKVNTWCKYPGRLDTYGCGCQHNCSYCYARSLLAFRGLWNPQAPAVARVPKIIHELDREVKRGDVVRIGGMTDCFMPLEEKTRATYMAIQMLNKRGIHQLIVTKSDLIAEPKYLAILDKELAHIQITITTTMDSKVARYRLLSIYLNRGGYLNLPLERKIELVDKITGYKERSVGEFVEEHHRYFSTHINANPEDCCNLRVAK